MNDRQVTPMRLALSYVRRSWRGVVALVVLTTMTSGLTMIGPALVAAALAALNVGGGDPALGGAAFNLNALGYRVLAVWPFRLFTEPTTLVVLIGVAYLVQAILAAVIQYSTSLASARIRTNILHYLQNDLMRHLLGQSLKFFNQMPGIRAPVPAPPCRGCFSSACRLSVTACTSSARACG
jgi:ABC-type multidrug transport system fused ATPase/permease subunit